VDRDSLIYVAGHRGLVGSALLRCLTARGYKNLVLRTSAELDLRRQADTEAFFEKQRPEYVFLAAAKVGGIVANSTYTAEFIYDNIVIAANVINSAYKYKAKKLLNLGSSCIYPKSAPQPMKEEHLLTGSLEPTNEPYAIAKIAAIKLCRYYNEQYGTNFISAMPSNLYGPNDNFNLETSHVLPALTRKFHLARLLHAGDLDALREDLKRHPLGFGIEGLDAAGEEDIRQTLGKVGISGEAVTLWGSGEPYREFLYSEDLADACVFLMEKYGYGDIGEFVNIGTGEDIRILDMANLIKDIVGFEGQIRKDASRPDGTPKKVVDVSRLSALGWRAQTGLAEGIGIAYKAYLST
jgi:GDP-L-fucose synthase